MARNITRITPTQAKLIRERLTEMIHEKRTSIVEGMTKGADVAEAQAKAAEIVKRLAPTMLEVSVTASTGWRSDSEIEVHLNVDETALVKAVRQQIAKPLADKFNRDKRFAKLKALNKEVEEALFLGQLGDESAVDLLDRLTTQLERI